MHAYVTPLFAPNILVGIHANKLGCTVRKWALMIGFEIKILSFNTSHELLRALCKRASQLLANCVAEPLVKMGSRAILPLSLARK